MNVEIIAVGNEIVTGKTVNTNATYIARQLQSIGLTPLYHSAVIDNKKQIESALQIAMDRSDVILCIGGLGPTEDDLTKETICEYLNKPLILYKDIQEKIESHFMRLKKTMPKNNIKQALFPEDCEVIPNHHGTAPGGLIEYQGKYIIFLPGPPKEIISMVDEFVVPYFEKKVEGAYYILDIKLFGIGESQMAEMIPDLLGDFGDIEVAPYVGNYEIVVRIKSFAKNKEEAKIKAEEIQKKLCNRLEEYIIGYNDNKLEEIVLELLEAKNYTIATAESCTGGMLAGTLVNCSGISSYFKEGIVSYSNEAKQKYLGVKAETLVQYGAVSEETAREMAEGIRKAAGTHIGLSTTGIAGPDGGTQEKPVGLVYTGISINDVTHVYKFNFHGNRQGIREKTVKNLLYQLLKELSK